MAKNPIVRLPKPIARGFSVLNRAMITASRGRLGSSFRKAPVILLTTTGRKTGKPRTWPLVGLAIAPREGSQGSGASDGSGATAGGWVVVASNGGHDAHPAWYLNLMADPAATVEVRGRSVDVRAREVDGAERSALWGAFVDLYSGYADYEEATDRTIPVLVLESVT